MTPWNRGVRAFESVTILLFVLAIAASVLWFVGSFLLGCYAAIGGAL